MYAFTPRQLGDPTQWTSGSRRGTLTGVDYQVLGPLDVTHPAVGPVKIEGAKTRALLVLLLLSRNTLVSVDRIADQLWDGLPPPSAAGTIHAHVSRLRRVLAGTESGPLLTRKPGYLLRVEPGECDIDRFAELVRQATVASPDRAAPLLGEALALWRGPALAEFADLTFAMAEADRLEELRLVAVERWVRAQLDLHQHNEMVPELERLVAENPLRESLTGLLMTALYRAGRQSEALRAYQATYRRLAEEIGVVPGPQLRAMESAILNHDPSLDPAPSAAGTGGSPGRGGAGLPRVALPAMLVRTRDQAPLVGRTTELARLREVWSDLGPTDARLLVVAGESGIGKSRLVAEFAHELHVDGATVLWGRAVQRQLVPYQALVEAIGDHLAALDGQTAARLVDAAGRSLGWLLPEFSQGVTASAEPAEPGARRYLMFEAVTTLLGELAAPAGVVLVLDDLHLADLSALSIVEHLVRRTRRGPMVVVATVDEALAGPGTALTAPLAELGRDGLHERIDLGGLSESAVGELMQHIRGEPGPLAAVAVREVYQRTQGNPLFVTVLASGDGADPVPARVRDYVSARLTRLDPELTEVLQAAALAGAEFEPEVLPELLDRPHETVEAVLGHAVRARVLDDVPGTRPRLRFVHQVVYDAVLSSLPAQRVAPLRARLVDALARRTDRAEHYSTLAHHYRLTAHDDARRSVEYSRHAGDHAMTHLGFAEAARHYESGLDTLASVPGDLRRDRCELLLVLGAARRALYQRLSTQDAFLAAAELAIELADSRLVVRAAWGLLTTTDYSARSADMVDVLRHGLAALDPGDSVARMALTAGLARALSPGPDVAALGRDAIDMARRLDDPEAMLVALGAGVLTTWTPDNLDERIAFSSEVIATGHDLGWVELAHEARAWRSAFAEELGDQAAADSDLALVRHWAQTSRQPFFQGLVDLRDAARALYQGRYDEAEKLAVQAVQGIDAGPDFQAGYAAQIFGLRRDTGRLGEIDAILAELVTNSPQVPAWRVARAVADLELHRLDASASTVDYFVRDGLAALPRDWLWLAAVGQLADCCADLALLGAPMPEAAETLYTLLFPFRDRCIVLAHGVLYDGAAARQLGALATVLHRHDDAAAHFETAITVNRRHGAAPWLARAQLGYADLLVRRGGAADVGRAAELCAEAATTIDAIGADGIAWRVTDLAARLP